MSQHTVSTYQDTFEIYELQEAASNSRILVCPERGGIVIGCQLHGEELFYLDKSTLDNPAANIRGGNPILFPICGSLENSTYQWEDRTYHIGQHGVARNMAWEVIGTSEDGEASLTLRIRANESTLEAFPFDFELIFTYALVDGELHTRQQYRHLGQDGPMPFYAGFHPYFAIEGSKDIAYDTDATRYIDYNDNVIKPYTGAVDLEPMKESFCLLDAKRSDISFPNGRGSRVRLTYDPIFKYVVIWTLKDRPFVCVEPWMAQPLELNRGEELVLLQAGETLGANMIISVER
ncbi:aldose epimerase family protein [Paenibacillus sp. strain BS8-2]